MKASSATVLRLFLTGAIIIAALAAALVFSGVWPPYYTRKFDDKDFGPPVLDFRFVAYDDLNGWRLDDPGPALEAFVRSCQRFEASPPEAAANPLENLGIDAPGLSLGGSVADWLRPCAEARALLVSAYSDPGGRRGALRAFFEFHFQPVEIASARAPLPNGRARRAAPRVETQGVFTGYFEPVYRASRQATAERSAPVLPRPDDLVEVDLGLFRDNLKGERIAGRVKDGRLTPYDDRAAIEGRKTHNATPLAWLDPNDLFFLQIQGSGRLEFDDGGDLRVGYAAQNGHAYTAIGKVMVQRQLMPLEAVTMQSIRSWLETAPPEDAQALRAANASYVYFTTLDEIAPELGPLGAQGAPLTPGRSLAVDRRYHTLGAPVWVEIEPVAGNGDGPIRRLMIAQDTGGAIRGPVRGDFFWGAGEQAGAIAGAMNARGRMVVLLPRRLAERLPERLSGRTKP
ncbi:murein transglycosylase A [Hyphococcus sp.]|uniref:murein transglycosylase A n=1 Tax=Hyphococcus sp. TaxID=2038636 RepID=UPI00208CB6D9|nr:MAG: membrane-bound lytic murein transglycosylase A [Marinicaulis sp.]